MSIYAIIHTCILKQKDKPKLINTVTKKEISNRVEGTRMGHYLNILCFGDLPIEPCNVSHSYKTKFTKRGKSLKRKSKMKQKHTIDGLTTQGGTITSDSKIL